MFKLCREINPSYVGLYSVHYHKVRSPCIS